ncbi:MAG: recombinase XerD, partial [Gemmatimonadaceae bacterium]|nr:recombinase XerD [Gemmatimonadaceae bacterium]
MPRLVNKPPKYRQHKASGQAIITVNGEDIYLGKHDTPQSRAEYDRIIGEWRANSRTVSKPLRKGSTSAAADITVAELLVAFWEYAQEHYQRKGQPTSEQANFRPIIRMLRLTYGDQPASEFGAIALRAMRQQMIDAGWSRKNINRNVGRIRQIFNWGLGRQKIPASSAYLSLDKVEPLLEGRTKARESAPVKPVPAAHVDAVRPYLSRQVEAMVDLQLLTGMRPGETAMMRGCDIDSTFKPWTYTPPHHKIQHHDIRRVIILGPRAQKIVEQFWKPDLQAYLFSPADAMRELREKLHQERTTPLNQG